MISLLLVLGLIVWGVFSAHVARWVSAQFEGVVLSVAVGLGVFVLMLVIPFVDELIGGWQFKSLCDRNRVVFYPERVGSGLVYRDDAESYRRRVSGTWVKVWRTPYVLRAKETGDAVLVYQHLVAEGGLLLPGFDSGNDPTTFSGRCVSAEFGANDLLSSRGLTLMDVPKAVSVR